MYDVIIVGGGAAGIFCGINCDRKYKILIIEKNKSLGRKVLLSGGERCNVSNEKINLNEDYFSNSKNFETILKTHFKLFSNESIKRWLSKKGIATTTEDRNRIILKSGNSKELVDIFTKELKKNGSKIMSNTEVLDIIKDGELFMIKTNKGVISAKKVVISTGGRSYSQVGTNGFGFNIARKFSISIVEPYKGLCGVTTVNDYSKFSGTTIVGKVEILIDSNLVYFEEGPVLFTHFGFSGPVIFNSVLAIGCYIRKNGISALDEEEYFKKNVVLKLIFNDKHITKKVKSELGDNHTIITYVQNFRGRKEAKVTGGGVMLNELSMNFESKKVRGLYFIGEVVDVTGKTGGFNLQWAWTSGYVCGKNF